VQAIGLMSFLRSFSSHDASVVSAASVTERSSSSGSFGTVDWQNGESLLALTRVLLLHDFGLRFSMPLNHLCPPVPQRLNYIHWVAELAAEPVQNEPGLTEQKRMRADVKGLDV